MITPYPPARDGIGAYSKRMVDEMGQQGHEAAVVSVRAATERPPEVIGSLELTPRRNRALLQHLARSIVDFDASD